MQRFFLASKTTFAFFLLLSWGCTKIDTTTLGTDLIPAVDNVTTFADTLLINGTQGIALDDTTRISRTDFHPLGSITNDPIFGTTNADLYLQVKPSFFPFYFGSIGDTITSFDSAVLCLSFKSYFGDSLKRQTLTVYKLNNFTSNFVDSSYRLNFTPDQPVVSTPLGTAMVLPTEVTRYTYFKGSKKDSINNQVRIPLSQAFLNELTATRDSSAGGRYHSDSLFIDQLKGLYIKAEGGEGNGLFYISLADAATRLEIHYKKKGISGIDTSFTPFYFSTGVNTKVSAQATLLVRNRAGAEISSPATNSLYIQTTPGAYANLSIPALSALPNSIIHRAEIVVEQIPSADPVDRAMLPPAYLYLDLLNDTSATNKFKPVYYDLNPSGVYNPDNLGSVYNLLVGGGIDYNYYGGYARVKGGGLFPRYYYTFNVSRHVQHIVTNGVSNYNFRLSAPFQLSYFGYVFPYKNYLADGRIKIGDGNNTNGYKMYMRVVYSKI